MEEGHRVLLQVDAAVLRGELAGEPVDDDLVEVVAAEVGVTVGGHDLEDTVAELEDGDIESTAAEVEDRDLGVLVLLVKTVGQSGCGRLIDDALDVETGDLASLLGGLALGVGEVCGDRDDSLGNLLAEIVLGSLLHLLEDDGGNLLRSIQAAVDVDTGSVVFTLDDFVGHAGDLSRDLVVGLAHETLDGVDGVGRIGDGLALGGIADFAFSAFGERHYGRSGTLAFIVDDDGRLVAFHD